MDRSAIATIACLLVSLLVFLLLLHRHHHHHQPSSLNRLLDQLHFAGKQQQLFLDSFRMRGVDEWLTAPVFVAPNAARPTLPPPPTQTQVLPSPFHSDRGAGSRDEKNRQPSRPSGKHEGEDQDEADEDEPWGLVESVALHRFRIRGVSLFKTCAAMPKQLRVKTAKASVSN
jgi:hypothetical protein